MYRSTNALKLLLCLGFGLCLAPGLMAAPVAQSQPFRDPTRPPEALSDSRAPVRQAAPLVLESVIFGPERRVAVINNRVLAEGDRFAPTGAGTTAELLEIEQHSVLVQTNGEAVRLHLPQLPDIRQRVSP